MIRTDSIPASTSVSAALMAVALVLAPPVPARAEDPRALITGRVIDSSSAEPIPGVRAVVEDKDASGMSDIDGRFRIEVSPGEYRVRLSRSGYRDFLVTEVEALEGDPAELQVVMQPTEEKADGPGRSVEEITVTATASAAGDAFQMLERQTADVMKDTLSSEFFRNAPDSDVGEVVVRLAAITVEEDFVFVRGLGSRYSTAVVNGSRLPSPNPNVRVVPLDLFPSAFVDSLAVIKSYSPNLQGDFSGGLVDINLKAYPEDFTWKIGVKMGGNTNTTFQDFATYDTARQAGDFFGIDTSRQLPAIFGDERVVFTDLEQPALYASTLEDVWSARTITAPINSGLEFEIGDRFDSWGYTLGVLWENKYNTVRDEIQRQFQNGATPPAPPAPQLAEDFLYDSSTFAVKLGAILTAAWDIDIDNRISTRILYQRLTEDEVLQGEGFRRQNEEITLAVTRLEYQKEDLAFGQFEGEHFLGEDLELDWRTAFGRTSLDRPDVRTTAYESTQDNPTPIYARTAGSGTRIWLDVRELMSDTQVDLAIPFDTWSDLQARLHVGGSFTWRNRESDMRRFLFRPVRTNIPGLFSQPPEAFLNSEKVAEGITNFFEETAPQDNFEASEQIAAGYVMLELPLVEDLFRFSGGVRLENSIIDITYYRQDLQGAEQDRQLKNLDPIPGVNLIFTPNEEMNLRGSYSRTVSRPEFRELSPIYFPEPFGLRTVVGNPDLVQSTIDSFDLRYEWFFSGYEMASIGTFYKRIQDPIERTVISLAATPATSFDNSESAWLFGFEFEVRKDFSFLGPDFANLMIFLNASWIESRAERGELQQYETSNLEGTARSLQGQAPFVINTTVQYESDDWGTFRVLYNTMGETLAELGESGLPDIFEARRNQLDFVWTRDVDVFEVPLAVKFSVENILNDRYLWTQGGITQRRFETGVTFGLSGSYRF